MRLLSISDTSSVSFRLSSGPMNSYHQDGFVLEFLVPENRASTSERSKKTGSLAFFGTQNFFHNPIAFKVCLYRNFSPL